MSHVPPPFSPSAPPARKDKTLTIVILVIVGLVLFCACGVGAVGWFGWGFVKSVGGPMASCMVSFEATRDGILAYAKEHGGRLPKAETWQEDVREYVRKELVSSEAKEMEQVLDAKIMDVDKEWGCHISDARTTGIAYNADLSGKLLSEIKDPWATPLIFEVEEPKKNAAKKYEPLPKSTSPTIMGNPRGWIRMPVQGEVQGFEGGNRNVRIDTRSDRDDSSGEPKGGQ